MPLTSLISHSAAVAGLALMISVPSSSEPQTESNSSTGSNQAAIPDSFNKPGHRLVCRRYLGCAPYSNSMPMLKETP